MNRITNKNLEAVVNRINRMAGTPEAPYSQVDGKHKANIGNYHLSWAYGGVALHQMVNESGGVRDVLQVGYATKRDLYHSMFAFIAGYDAGCEAKPKLAA